MNRMETDLTQIDLIRAGQGPVSVEADDLLAKYGRQSQRCAIEARRPGACLHSGGDSGTEREQALSFHPCVLVAFYETVTTLVQITVGVPRRSTTLTCITASSLVIRAWRDSRGKAHQVGEVV